MILRPGVSKLVYAVRVSPLRHTETINSNGAKGKILYGLSHSCAKFEKLQIGSRMKVKILLT